MVYQHTTVGGTFDHFHAGHEALLTAAFEEGEKVWLGITSDDFVKNKLIKTELYGASIESYQQRQKSVHDFLAQKGWLSSVHILPIEDRFGTTLTDRSIQSIVVSPETYVVADEINQLRRQKGWPALVVKKVPWVLAKDGQPIHSTRIRKGIIGRNGEIFGLFDEWGVRTLPTSLRKILKAPLGLLIQEKNHDFESAGTEFKDQFLNKNFLTITVGDAVCDSLVKIGITPDVSVIDLHIQRKSVYQNSAEIGLRGIKVLKKAGNQAGTLSFAVYSRLFDLIHTQAKPSILQINGEEDLLTLFAILCAPLQSHILYGQPGEGIVVVVVTEEKKIEIKKMLEQFVISNQ